MTLSTIQPSNLASRRDLFLLCHKPQVTELIRENSSLCGDVAGMIADYVTGHEHCFGVEEWKKYYGVSPENPCDLPFSGIQVASRKVTMMVREHMGINKDVAGIIAGYVIDAEYCWGAEGFYDFWHGPDPIDPTKQRCETHHMPFICPERVIRVIDDRTHEVFPYNFETLQRLMQNPITGRPSRLVDTKALRQHLTTEPGPLTWEVARMDVVARDLPYDKQMEFIARLAGGYECESSGIDLATRCATEHSRTGERHLGDLTGAEKRFTYGRCKERVKYGETFYQMIVGGFAPSGLRVRNSLCYNCDKFGVVLLRKF